MESNPDPVFIETFSISQLMQMMNVDKTLDISPGYQRRSVWTSKEKALLIDSIARKIPCGAITLFQPIDPSDDSAVSYEVVDGRQRLLTISDFVGDKLKYPESILDPMEARRDEEDDDDDESRRFNEQYAKAFYSTNHSKLTKNQQVGFGQFKFAALVIKGNRDDAVGVFTRMNKNVKPLRPQEIRNAVFYRSEMLRVIEEASKRLHTNLNMDPESRSFFDNLGVYGDAAINRMADQQLLAELLVLLLDGPQEARRSLDQKFEQYSKPQAKTQEVLDERAELLIQLLSQIWIIFGRQPMQAAHFPGKGAVENDLYALVGALKERGALTQPQMEKHADALREHLSMFRQQLSWHQENIRNNAPISPEQHEGIPEYYGSLGGQANSARNRKRRIAVWENLINDVVDPIDVNRFSKGQRLLAWAHSVDKTCGVCNKPVDWKDYELGHKDAHALGGPSLLSNAQIEHKECNRKKGASSGGTD